MIAHSWNREITWSQIGALSSFEPQGPRPHTEADEAASKLATVARVLWEIMGPM
jgi:hypothetical protein